MSAAPPSTQVGPPRQSAGCRILPGLECRTKGVRHQLSTAVVDTSKSRVSYATGNSWWAEPTLQILSLMLLHELAACIVRANVIPDGIVALTPERPKDNRILTIFVRIMKRITDRQACSMYTRNMQLVPMGEYTPMIESYHSILRHFNANGVGPGPVILFIEVKDNWSCVIVRNDEVNVFPVPISIEKNACTYSQSKKTHTKAGT